MVERLVVAEIIQPNQEVEGAQLIVRRDQISPDELLAAHEHILGQPDRKLLYCRPDCGPYPDLPSALEPLTLYAPLVATQFVAKRYDIGADSAAFFEHGPHRDPAKFHREIFATTACLHLSTLGGCAIGLVQWSEQEAPVAVALRPNTIMELYDNPLHGVSGPLSQAALTHFCATGELDVSLGAPEPRTFFFAGADYDEMELQLLHERAEVRHLAARAVIGDYDTRM